MALVLTRKKGETIRIGKDIYVTVGSIRGDRVRIEVEAPPRVAIDREEIAQIKSTEAKR